MSMNRFRRTFIKGLLACVVAGPAFAQSNTLRVGATVATAENGLLRALLQEFSRQSGVKVQLLEVPGHDVGILTAGGRADVVINSAERVTNALNYNGYIADMVPLMHRDYVVVGPLGDPAGLSEERSVKGGLRRLFRSRRKFISRGDNSQDHANEVGLWVASGYRPQGQWYRSVGLDTNGVMEIASTNGAYALVDQPSWEARPRNLRLQVVMSNMYELSRNYTMLLVNPERVPGVNLELARAFAEWAHGPAGQRFIANYVVNGLRPYRSVTAVK